MDADKGKEKLFNAIKGKRLDYRASMETEGITDTFPFSKYYLERCVGCINYDQCIKNRSAMMLCAECFYYRWQLHKDEESIDARMERVKDKCKAKEKELEKKCREAKEARERSADMRVGKRGLVRWMKKLK